MKMHILPTDPRENWNTFGKPMFIGFIIGILFIGCSILLAYLLK